MEKSMSDLQRIHTALSTVTGVIPAPASPLFVSLAEIGVNVTTDANEVWVQGVVAFTSTLPLALIGVKVYRDRSIVVYTEQIGLTAINSVVDVPVNFTDVNTPIGFHTYTLTAELVSPGGETDAYVTGSVALSGLLLQ